MQDEIIASGVELMLYGMGTVVVFLALLVVTTSAMSRLLGRYFPEVEPVPATASRPVAPAVAPTQDAQLVAVITAAVHQHRSRRQ